MSSRLCLNMIVRNETANLSLRGQTPPTSTENARSACRPLNRPKGRREKSLKPHMGRAQA
jgi:hypothetical protein